MPDLAALPASPSGAVRLFEGGSPTLLVSLAKVQHVVVGFEVEHHRMAKRPTW